jgi:hypothetical protein
MKVKDLIPILERAGDETEVLLSSDEEGNSCNKAHVPLSV